MAEFHGDSIDSYSKLPLSHGDAGDDDDPVAARLLQLGCGCVQVAEAIPHVGCAMCELTQLSWGHLSCRVVEYVVLWSR